MKHDPFPFTKCSICDKEFIEAPESIYRMSVKGKSLHACSYSCWNKLKLKYSKKR